GPGSVGSSKYDITQAYIANNTNHLFFGMERRGNNGTTAFDFEFNQLPPVSLYVPNRSAGDVLFSFEMQGSGGSGSAVPHVFIWNTATTHYDEITSSLPSGVFTSINLSPVAAAPWGYVDSKGTWTTGSIPNFEFAEATVPFGPGTGVLPNIVGCGGVAYGQVRTRASVSDA